MSDTPLWLGTLSPRDPDEPPDMFRRLMEQTPLFETVERHAVLSDDGLYRYRLERIWHVDEPAMVFIMLNPSTADAEVDDKTLRRCIGFARRENCGGVIIVNVYAARTPYPAELANIGDPIGPHNPSYLVEAFAALGRRTRYVAAWGEGVRRLPVWEQALPPVIELARAHRRELECLGVTKDGSPRHPLYLRGEAPLTTWEVPEWVEAAVAKHSAEQRSKRQRMIPPF